jgi:hypothetical protein
MAESKQGVHETGRAWRRAGAGLALVALVATGCNSSPDAPPAAPETTLPPAIAEAPPQVVERLAKDMQAYAERIGRHATERSRTDEGNRDIIIRRDANGGVAYMLNAMYDMQARPDRANHIAATEARFVQLRRTVPLADIEITRDDIGGNGSYTVTMREQEGPARIYPTQRTAGIDSDVVALQPLDLTALQNIEQTAQQIFAEAHVQD